MRNSSPRNQCTRFPCVPKWGAKLGMVVAGPAILSTMTECSLEEPDRNFGSAKPCIQLFREFQRGTRVPGRGPCTKARLDVEFCQGLGCKFLENLVKTEPAMQGQRLEAFKLVVRQAECECTHRFSPFQQLPGTFNPDRRKSRLLRLNSRLLAVMTSSAPPATARSRK